MRGNAAFYSLILFCTGITTIGKEIKVKWSFCWDKPNQYLVLYLAFQLFHNKRQTCLHRWNGSGKVTQTCTVKVPVRNLTCGNIHMNIHMKPATCIKGYVPKFDLTCKPRYNWSISLAKEDVKLWNLNSVLKKIFGII